MTNPNPTAMPNMECIMKANPHASRGLGVRLANRPLPRAGMKKNQGTMTLTMPNRRPCWAKFESMMGCGFYDLGTNLKTDLEK